MSIPEKHHHREQLEADAALRTLRTRAAAGDRHAVEAIRDIALNAIATLDAINAEDVARESHRWPVALAAIKEIRTQQLSRFEGLAVGADLGMKLAGKRKLAYDSQTGFAYDLFASLEIVRRNRENNLHPADQHPELNEPGVLTSEQAKREWRHLAAMLPPLSKDSLADWTSAAVELCREYCMGRWDDFPWPETVAAKAQQVDDDGHVRGAESAAREKIERGLKSLIP